MEVCGTPNSDFMNRIESTDGKSFIEHEPNYQKRELFKLFPNITEAASDLIHKMLEWDPNIRITAENALKHPYLEEFSDATDVPTGLFPKKVFFLRNFHYLRNFHFLKKFLLSQKFSFFFPEIYISSEVFISSDFFL